MGIQTIIAVDALNLVGRTRLLTRTFYESAGTGSTMFFESRDSFITQPRVRMPALVRALDGFKV